MKPHDIEYDKFGAFSFIQFECLSFIGHLKKTKILTSDPKIVLHYHATIHAIYMEINILKDIIVVWLYTDQYDIVVDNEVVESKYIYYFKNMPEMLKYFEVSLYNRIKDVS